MINFTEIQDSEAWELFARDFLSEIGFYIESSPDRGADAGKDMLASEELSGKLGKYRFRWLVSCKHNATSGRAVNENDEQNIIERVKSFEADGFIGFYSTVPSAALNTRLRSLQVRGEIRDFRMFDHQLIENYLIRVGYSNLVMRYFPESYKLLRPLHQVSSDYIALACKVCGKDLLEQLYHEEYGGLVGFVQAPVDDENPDRLIEEVYWACKGQCDQIIERRLERSHKFTTWDDISDLVIPIYFLRFIFSVQNSIYHGNKRFSEKAFEQLKEFIAALAQKVLRETTPKERERVGELISIMEIFGV
jgi:hypothetical protein